MHMNISLSVKIWPDLAYSTVNNNAHSLINTNACAQTWFTKISTIICCLCHSPRTHAGSMTAGGCLPVTDTSSLYAIKTISSLHATIGKWTKYSINRNKTCISLQHSLYILSAIDLFETNWSALHRHGAVSYLIFTFDFACKRQVALNAKNIVILSSSEVLLIIFI